ncbi:hypothetical protein AGMMS50268_00020 [Spirochaetia bacterium]|nr:hypothetical protein AGMMS50268_00020 [Spirochaetia bacterium]
MSPEKREALSKWAKAHAKIRGEIRPPKFDIPKYQLFCEKCGTTSYFYNDKMPPFHCAECGLELQDET